MADVLVVTDAKPDRGAVLVVDDDASIRLLVTRLLEHAGYATREAETGEAALAALEQLPADCVVLDVMMPELGGVDVLRACRARFPDLPVIMLTAKQSVDTAVECIKLGAFDYQLKPIDRDRLETNVANAVRQYRLTKKLAAIDADGDDSMGLVGSSQPMQQLRADIRRAARTNISVHVHGESGTGKELVARAIHFNSGRAARPFVAVNCGAIPPSLQESELFGHERGSFTGATGRHVGWFEQAQHGTVFLDEVAELSASAQIRLLRVLQEHRLRRIGSTRDVELDVRVLSATHQDLAAKVRDGSFREDLYYRLMVFPLAVVPLRDRTEDIPGLIQHFVAKHSDDAAERITSVAPEALEALTRHPWRGNVRELENAIHRAIVVTDGPVIGLDALPAEIATGVAGDDGRWRPGEPGLVAANADVTGQVVPLAALERQAIHAALAATDGNVSEAARKLGIGRATLYRKLAKYDTDGDSDVLRRIG